MKFVLAVAILITFATPAAYASDADCSRVIGQDACVNAEGSNDNFIVSGSDGSTGGGASAGVAAGASQSATYTIADYAPACTGNDRINADLICASALQECVAEGQGFISYWRWEATVVRATREIVDPPGWVKQPGTACLGPQAQGVPLLAAIAGVVAGDFQELVVLRGAAISDPRGRTLVNYDTRFHTDARRYVLDPVTVLGHRVVVTATPTRYDWYFGDGTTLQDGGSGTERPVVHVYTATGRVSPYVVVTWTGTFSVDGGPQQPVVGTAVTTGPGTPLVVREARSQLVSGR